MNETGGSRKCSPPSLHSDRHAPILPQLSYPCLVYVPGEDFEPLVLISPRSSSLLSQEYTRFTYLWLKKLQVAKHIVRGTFQLGLLPHLFCR
ncbi:hypothetical protein BRARA_H01529 [Brassica rapa]|uniref:Uncharacterized protein n=1 Tax=Brassica campestris TaxID=3711 RepID=A0A397YBY2_BRACM|nr:hypothetical protein BRARA_H01529 [Brassica rapa]CAG7903598.1 unnamed protein product [Brassica rapa]